MSKVSDVFDNMLSRLVTVLGAGWNELPNAYEVVDNPENILTLGYGLAYGPGQNFKKSLGSQLSMKRELVVLLSRKVDATDLDPTSLQTVAKQLLEDLHTVVAEFEKNTSINTGQIVATFESDTGVQFLGTGTGRFVYVQGTFSATYFEQN